MAGDRVRGRRLDPSARRRQLVEVGLELLERGSQDAPSPREVAERADIAAGLLYRYFPDKQAFRTAVLAEAAERLTEATRWPQDGFGVALRASLHAQLDFATRHPGLWRALTAGSASPAIRQRVRSEEVGRVLRRAGAGPPSAQAAILLHGWVGFCAAAIEAWLDDPTLTESELVEVLAAALEPALAALGSRTPPRPRTHKPRVRLLAAARSMS